MKGCEKPIGFFDSGVGGISVLREAVKMLPKENYIYFGDSENAPYGIKSEDEIKKLTIRACEKLLERNVKAIVVACNTATSVAINTLREEYKRIPIIGIEPALKPAAQLNKDGKILIMATPMTLKLEKFAYLVDRYGKSRDIVSIPCDGLVEFIERGELEGTRLNEFLREKLKSNVNENVAAVVLGCTHYPFIKKELSKILKDSVLLDGSIGTVKQLKRKLTENNALNNSTQNGTIQLLNSSNDGSLIKLSRDLLYISKI